MKTRLLIKLCLSDIFLKKYSPAQTRTGVKGSKGPYACRYTTGLLNKKCSITPIILFYNDLIVFKRTW